MIEVRELTRRYGDKTAIEGVSFHVEQGEILGFLGPNGAGKSTTMRILAGALGATRGSAFIEGINIAEDPRNARLKFGYLPEIPPVYPDMTVWGYLDYVARLHYVSRHERPGAIERVLKQCGLDDVSHRLIGNLSKGYQQRVGLAQALVHDPPVLILDEPTVGLDPNQITEVRRLIKSLAGKHTIILSTHILPEVQMTCSRVAIINRGRIVAEDTIENLSLQVQKHDRIALLIRSPGEDVLADLQAIEGVENAEQTGKEGEAFRFVVTVEPGHDVREQLAHLVVTRQWGLLDLHREKISLEDVFRELTTEEPQLGRAEEDAR